VQGDSILRGLARLLVAVALPLTAGCFADGPAPLRVGINLWPGFEFLYLAQEEGFFRAEGLEVRLVEFGSLSDARRAYERGQLDAFGATVIEVLQVRVQSSRSPQIVQVTDYSDGADVVLARPDFATAAGLKGARIGVELASLGVYVLARALQGQGLTLADVTIVSLNPSSMADAWRNGDVDAVVTYPPTAIDLLRGPNAKAVFSTSEIPGEVMDVVAVEAEVCARRPKEIAGLLRAFYRAVDYAQQNPAAAYRTMAEREGLTAAEFGAALAGGIRLVPASEQAAFFRPGGKLAVTIDASDRFLRASGQIKGSARSSDIVNGSFVRHDAPP